MSDWDERVQKIVQTVEHDPDTTYGLDYADGYADGGHQMARWQRKALLADEAVERAARAVAGLEPGEGWPTNAEMGGGPTGTRDDEYRSECVRTARAALTAALGEEEG